MSVQQVLREEAGVRRQKFTRTAVLNSQPL